VVRSSALDDSCGVAQALGVLSDPWCVLVVRDVARGHTRFEALLAESGISRKVLAQRLESLLDSDVLVRTAYSEHPPRHDYVLTARGRALLPVLAALQDWGDTWLLSDGKPTAVRESTRVHDLVGERIPSLVSIDPVAATPWTVVYCFPGAGVPGLEELAGGVGCTLESCTYRDRLAEFAASGASVVGVSTQRPDEQSAFARHHKIQFPLLSDADLELTSALRLPTVRVGGAPRIHRLTLVVDAARVVRRVLHPITDVTGSVEDALASVRSLASRSEVSRPSPAAGRRAT
jgi:DNA-binding HxlR family transcriptional regulator/peroxiredoxin